VVGGKLIDRFPHWLSHTGVTPSFFGATTGARRLGSDDWRDDWDDWDWTTGVTPSFF